MKYLIAENLKVKWKGEFVVANETDGEFIFDTEAEQQLTKATLVGIAEANAVAFNKKDNVATLVGKLDQHFSNLELLEVTKMSDEATVEKIVIDGVAADKSEDEMLVEIVNSGVSFKNALKLFKRVMESKGLRLTAKKRKEKIQELIDELEFAPESGEDVKKMVEKITGEVPDTNEKQALGVLRRWAKGKEIELPKYKKTAGPGGFRAQAFAWMVENPTAQPEQFHAWVEEQGKSEAVAKRFVGLFEVARKMAEGIIAAGGGAESEAA